MISKVLLGIAMASLLNAEVRYEKYFPQHLYSNSTSTMSLSVVKGTKAYDDLFHKYGSMYNVPSYLLKAIAKTESGFNELAINKSNRNGTIDRGLMQINSVHDNKLLAKGLVIEDVFKPEVNIELGAIVLSYCMQKYDNHMEYSLNCYNGKVRNNDYATRVWNNVNIHVITDSSYIVKR